jgi:hypothetical protein
MPLRLDNARALPTCPQQEQQKNNSFESRFEIDLAASPMPEIKQPERLPPRATSNRKGGRDHLGILGEIKSVHPGEIVGINREARRMCCSDRLNSPRKAAVREISGYGMAVAGVPQYPLRCPRPIQKKVGAQHGMWKSAVDEKIAPVVHAHVQRYGILQQWLQGRVWLQPKAAWYFKAVIFIHGDRHRRQWLHRANAGRRK